MAVYSTPAKIKPRRRKPFKRWIKICHYWLSTLVCVQLIIWLITGVYFNLTPHDELRGMIYNHSHHSEAQSLNLDPEQLLDVTSVLELQPQTQRVKLITIAEQPIYLLNGKLQRYQHQCQELIMVDAYTGTQFIINSTIAELLALNSYMGPGQVTSIEKVSAAHNEWPKQCNPMWKISMDDDLSTRIYINAVNGDLVGHKNQQTQIADFMFKLHFMDYLNQGSFNNPFSWLFAILTLVASLSGLYWVVENLALKRYRI